MVFSTINVLGGIIYLYLVWRNLKDDYQGDELISYSWMSLLFFIIGGRLLYGILGREWENWVWTDWFRMWSKPGFDFIGAYAGWLGLTLAFAWIKKWKIMYILEDTVGLVWVLLTFLLTDVMVKGKINLYLTMATLLVLVGYLMSSAIKGKYRSLWWYRSGKKGFVFWFTNIIVGLPMGAGMIIFAQGWEKGVFLIIWSLISVTGLVILGDERRKK